MFVGSNSRKRPQSGELRSGTSVENLNSEVYLFEQWRNDCKDQEGCQQIINSHLPYLTLSLQNQELRQLGMFHVLAPLFLMSSYLSCSLGYHSIVNC